MVLGKLVGKIKRELKRIPAGIKKTYYEEKEKRRIKKMARKIEERHKARKRIEKYLKMGYDLEDATILARRDEFEEKERKRSESLNKILNAIVGSSKEVNVYIGSPSAGKKSKKGRMPSRSVLDDLDRHLRELDAIAGLSSGGRRRKGKGGGIEDIDFWRLMQV